MADNLNHSSVDITNEVINIGLHLEDYKRENYFRVSKFLNDYTPAFKHHGMSEEEIKKYSLQIGGRYNKSIYQMIKQTLSIENMTANLWERCKHIWEVPFNIDNYVEDNDTSSSEEEDSEEENNKIVVVDG